MVRQLGPCQGVLFRNCSAVSKHSDRKPADPNKSCIEARMSASSSTTKTVGVSADTISSSIVNALTPLDCGEFESSALSVLFCYESKRAARQNQELNSARENPQCVSARESSDNLTD